MATHIEAGTEYILLPMHEEGIELKSKVVLGKDLLKDYDINLLEQALELGRNTIIYKGNEYFIDIKIPD